METPPVRTSPAPKPPAHVPQRVYSAPRQFGIATMLWVATACGLLIWALQLVDTPPPVIIAISVFLAVVAGMQAVFKESPRWASVITGEVCVVGCFGYLWIAEIREPFALCVAPFVISFGLLAGYCGGAVVAGFFMVVENVSNHFARNAETEQPATSVWDDDYRDA